MLPERTDLELRELFQTLKASWKNSTCYYSSTTQICMNEDYQRIIGLGPRVLPLILEDLEKGVEFWMWALRALTGENPIHPEDRGDMEMMRSAWLHWARDNGYLT
jgi:hypothetical protein